jgi:hypothetical protein
MAFPVGFADFVADQAVDRLRVRDAQQRFGKTQQRYPFRRGQRVFVQEGVDPALADLLAADCGDQAACLVGNPVTRLCWDFHRREEARHRLGLVDPTAVAHRGAQWRRRRRRGGEHQLHAVSTVLTLDLD